MIQKNGKGDINLPLPKLHDSNKVIIIPQTRGFDSGNCLICQVGQLKRQSTKLTYSNDQDLKESSSSFDKLCSNCLSAIKRGITHDRSQATKFENLKKMVVTDSRSAEKIEKGILSTGHN